MTLPLLDEQLSLIALFLLKTDMVRTLEKSERKLPAQRVQELLENGSGRRLRVKINDNRSTMLSVRWEPDYTRVSLHRMFLQAPGNIMEALACYIKDKNRILSPDVKRFIEENSKHLDYSQTIDQKTLQIQGSVWNLKQLYDEINNDYFNNRLRLLITWFHQPKLKRRSQVTLGLYQDTLRLVKINRLLDDRSIPNFIIRFVIYHEMLHAVCPPQVDEYGINHVHSKRFRELEMQFEHYAQAKRWIQNNREALFGD